MEQRPEELTFRNTDESDVPDLIRWLSDEAILRWFPMTNAREIEDAVRIWVSFGKIGAGLTALRGGERCGAVNLYIQPFKKLAHTCLFSIVVDASHRNKGIGAALIRQAEKLAKEKFGIEILHLEVYEGNPAKRLYERMGFKEYGVQKHFIKDRGDYIAKIFMQKSL